MTAAARTLRLVVAAAVAAAMMLPLAWVPPKAAAQTEPDGTEGSLDFVSQTTWHEAGTPVELRVRVATDRPVDELELAATTFRPTRSRTEFQQTLTDRIRSSVISLTRVPLAEVVPSPDGSTTLALNPPLGRSGVYPIRLELREKGGGEVIDSLVTHVAHLAEPVEAEPFLVAPVIPVQAPPAVTAAGGVEVPASVSSRLARLAAVLQQSEVAHTVLPTAETLDALVESDRPRDAETYTSLVAPRADRQVVAGHYVPTSLPAFLRADLEAELVAQRLRGVGRLAEQYGAFPDTATWVAPAGLDEAALAYLADDGVSRMVVPEANLVPIDRDLTLTAPFRLSSAGQTVRAVAVDPALSHRFMASDDGPALSAQHLLAELAVLFFDAPGTVPRGVPLLAPPAGDVDEAFLSTLLNGLAGSPVLRAATLDTLFDRVDDARQRRGPLIRELESRTAERTRLDGGEIRATRGLVRSFATLLTPGTPLLDELDRMVLAAESSALGAAARERLLAGARAVVEEQAGLVRMPAERSITLTAREGDIPVTITSDAPYPLTVVLVVESDTLAVPGGSRRTLQLERRNTTERIQVRTNASGSFPLRVRLEAPDGGLVLAETRFRVRSTAVSGVGVGLSVGAGLFLVVWWGRHLRGRRARKLVPA